MNTATRKIGKNKGKARLWIEGAYLIESGFNHGARFDIETVPGEITYTLHAEGKRKVAGNPARPIIDTLGKALETAGFETGDVVTLEKSGNVITITKEGE